MNRHGQPLGKWEFGETRHGDVNGFAAGKSRGRGGKFGDLLAVEFVSHADFEFVKTAQDVQFGQCETREPVDALSLAHDHGVKPSASTLPACGGAEFLANRPHVFTRLVVEFGGHGAMTNTGDVGLGDANDITHVAGMNTRTVRGVTSRGDG